MQFMSQYKEAGYLPEAMVNFLALLGWSPSGEQEIFSMEELIKEKVIIVSVNDEIDNQIKFFFFL